MKVSIIMCAHNVAEFIERAVDSIVAQTYQNWELIISNDASTDNTRKLLERYLSDSRIILLNQPINYGYVKNKNLAFSYATGALLTQLDADDTCPPERIEKQVRIFRQYDEINLCGTNFQRIDTLDLPLDCQKYEQDFLINKPKITYPFWFPGLMYRRSMLEEFGSFSEYFVGVYGDDHYWTIRANTKHPIYFISDVLYNYRINPNSLTNVLDNSRKLIVSDIISELLRQQLENGRDWLEDGDIGKMEDFEQKVLNNKTLMAEKYRLWAAKAIDYNDFIFAKSLLKKAVRLQSSNRDIYRTMIYYIRRRIFS